MTPDSRRAGTGRIVVALGGNTLLGADTPWTMAEQRDAIDATAATIVDAIEAGYEVVLTHGNGPQVGSLLLQQERVDETPHLPLDVLVAETQAQIGYLLQQALDNRLSGGADYLTIVTQVVVDPQDSAFDDPTKPVGPFYSEAEAATKPFETRAVGTGDRPYRRVVPSPTPRAVVELDEIGRLLDIGTPVIAGGGGGVPVVRDDGLRGVEAVVDKDRTSRRLAAGLGIDTLVILTDVAFASVDFGTPEQRPLREVSAATIRNHLEAGEFGTGSMEPKIDAASRFVEGAGDRAVITAPEHLMAALDGEAGTRIVS
jgi:carbamate kinase